MQSSKQMSECSRDGWKWQNGIKDGPFPSPAVLWVISVCEKKTLTEKNNIETSQLIYRANQLTGFYMVVNLAYNELKAYLRPCQKSTMKCFAKTVASY